MQQTLGLSLLGSLCSVCDLGVGVEEFVHLRLEDWMFTPTELPVYEYVTSHLSKFGALPALTTIHKHTGVEISDPPEPPSYYRQEVYNRYLYYSLKKAMLEANEALKDKDPRKALSTLIDKTTELYTSGQGYELVDFAAEGGDLISTEYETKKLLGGQYGIQTGWQSLDYMTGGLQGGDVLTIVGRPSTGKTYLGLYIGHHVWAVQKKVPLIVSMEMKAIPILQRIAAIETKVPTSWIKHGEIPTLDIGSGNQEKKFFKHLSGLKSGSVPLWVADGNLASTARDITLLARKLHPDVLILDGGYLVTSTNARWKAGWEKIKEVVEELKRDASNKLNIPVVISYQFNREALKDKKKNESYEDEIGLEHIAGGDAIGQISSIVLGVFGDAIEGLVKKKIRLLKGRSGERGEFWINWRFEAPPCMDFSEIPKVEQDADLQYLT
ncbi:MAG: DnaB-like helicase C-terminal domain-containing protein [bacterium]